MQAFFSLLLPSPAILPKDTQKTVHAVTLRRGLAAAAGALILALCVLRFCWLKADFPNFSPWLDDQAKYTDEGWWAGGAVMHQLLGHWNVPGDYNPAAALPVWPILLGLVFQFTGVSLVAARALSVFFSLASLGIVFLLMRRFTGDKSAPAAMLAVLLLASNPFLFAFSRLAILDSLVIFEFCLLLLIASMASLRRLWTVAALAALATVMLLTKTTAVLLFPAALWIAWQAMGKKLPGLLGAIATIGVLPAIFFETHAAMVSHLGYGEDYRYFFDVNRTDPIVWSNSWDVLKEMHQSCFWLDGILYPAGLLVLPLSVVWLRRLWSNPLFTACWLALGAQAVFLFTRQDNSAPRYFLVMAAPLVMIVVLTWQELLARSGKIAALLLLAMVVSIGINTMATLRIAAHRQYQFVDAAEGIKRIVNNDGRTRKIIFGVSGAQISLMTGIPSINDAFSVQEMTAKVARYQPGWYLVWNGIAEENHDLLAPYRLEEVARYPVFDNEDRNLLILYRMVRH